jgi:tetratricopeptide (TPR) repeat protein
MESIKHFSDPYELFVDFIVETVFNDHQRQEYKKIYDSCVNCFVFAKQNNLDEAKKCFEESIFLFESCENKHWISTLCMPKISYYEYKTANYESAIYRSNQIIESLKYLQKNNYQYLFLSEVQQFHNLSRIYFTLNNTREAVAICVKCLVGIYEHSGKWRPGMIINGIPEEYIIAADVQYIMITQVTTETFLRILRMFEADAVLLRYWLKQFIDPLSEISFSLISTDRRYKYIDALISFLQGMILNKGETDYGNLLFIEKANIDKALLKVLYGYIKFSIVENEKALVMAYN